MFCDNRKRRCISVQILSKQTYRPVTRGIISLLTANIASNNCRLVESRNSLSRDNLCNDNLVESTGRDFGIAPMND